MNETRTPVPFESLDPKAHWSLRLAAMVWTTFALLALIMMVLWPLSVFWEAIDPNAAAVLIGLGVANLWAWWFGGARWRSTRFALTEHGLRIQRGVWWRSDSLIPRSRLQHIDVHRGPLDRRLGLAGLWVYTAGTELGRMGLNGLPAARAEALRDALVQTEVDGG
ncbi:MAG: PH domain-containing protein [Xanthomonadales bacterium]|nr:PH domain-containing protein [Xanthomonadales bacterium]